MHLRRFNQKINVITATSVNLWTCNMDTQTQATGNFSYLLGNSAFVHKLNLLVYYGSLLLYTFHLDSYPKETNNYKCATHKANCNECPTWRVMESCINYAI